MGKKNIDDLNNQILILENQNKELDTLIEIRDLLKIKSK